MICDNPKCQYYRPLPPSLPVDAEYVDVVVNHATMFDYGVKRVTRQLYLQLGIGGRVRYFCDSCHNAIEISRRG